MGKDLEKTYPSGDLLILEKSSGMYNQYGHLYYWQVVYGEKIPEGYSAINTEYFLITDYEKAKEAYLKREASERPALASGLGTSLSEIATQNLRYHDDGLVKCTEMLPIPPNSNPYLFDRIRSGLGIVGTLEIMYRDVDQTTNMPAQLVLINKTTGRRVLIDISKFTQTQEERIEQVTTKVEEQDRKIATLEDLRFFIRQLPVLEQERPAIVCDKDGNTYSYIKSIRMTESDNPLIQNQYVLQLE